MKKCKIEVIRTMFNEDLAKEYGCQNLGKCPFHREGDIFYADYAKPENFCDEAWKAIHHYVFAIAHDSGTFFYNDWICQKGLAICSCNDGLRPVIFKITQS